jgi:N-methylhydantoinase A
VTDADLVLGKLDPDNFAGGAIPLHPTASEKALSTHMCDTLDMDAQTAAFGLAEVVDENMANAARVHAVENGEDLSEYTMIAVARCLVPSGAGVGSAIGFLRAPFSFEANRSVYMRLSDFDPSTVADLFGALEEEATAFVRSCDAKAPIEAAHKVYMRYAGQGWEIPVSLSPAQAAKPDRATYQDLFEADYAKLFGRTVEGMDIEITVWSVNATTPVPPTSPAKPMRAGKAATPTGKRQLFDPAFAQAAEANIINRDDMAPGQTAKGPAVIVEDETSVILPASRHAIMQADGTIDITEVSQ